jgi:hypothetical protein
MLNPAVGIGRKVRVVGEDIFGRRYRFQLYQKTFGADVRMERIRRFRFSEMLRPHIGVGQWRVSEIHKGVSQNGATASTAHGFVAGHVIKMYSVGDKANLHGKSRYQAL